MRSIVTALRRLSVRRKLQFGFGFLLAGFLLLGGGVVVAAVRMRLLLQQLLALELTAREVQAPIVAAIERLLATQAGLAATVIGAAVVMALVGTFVAYVVGRQISRSMRALQEAAERLGAGDLSARVDIGGADEIAVTARALNSMADRLQTLLSDLEQKVKERTRSLEQRARQVTHAAEVAGAVTAFRDPHNLAEFAVKTVSGQFGFDQVNILLVDEASEYLVTAAVSGGGAPGKRQKIGGESVIGWVAAHCQPRIASEFDAGRAESPDSPAADARSELALPLLAGDVLLGVLDIRSRAENAFSQDDISVLEIVADQVAIALANSRLLIEAERRRQEIEALYNQLTQQAWAEYTQAASVKGYRYAQAGARPAEDAWLPPMRDALKQRRPRLETRTNGEVIADLALPITLRGQVIGALGLRRQDGGRWSETEVSALETVAEQIALAMENARLHHEERKTAVQLRETDRLKSEFLTTMSHELRTPLNSIIGFSEVLLEGLDGDLSENATTDIKAIYTSGQHLLALINDILDLAKIEAGRMELVRKPTSLHKIVQTVKATSASLVKDRKIELIIPDLSDLPLVNVDETRMSQIILNLVSNAVKFTLEGHVAIAAWQDRDKIVVKVEDTGIGIPESSLPVIFERFRQVDGATTRKAGGTGLGLTITRHLVEMHGGEIWVESQKNVGTTFYFTIPLEERSETGTDQAVSA